MSLVFGEEFYRPAKPCYTTLSDAKRAVKSEMKSETKYQPLHNYLKQLPQEGPVELTFDEIQSATGIALPHSARASRAWWANSANLQGKAWLEAGWLVDAVDIDAARLVFRPARITAVYMAWKITMKPIITEMPITTLMNVDRPG